VLSVTAYPHTVTGTLPMMELSSGFGIAFLLLALDLFFKPIIKITTYGIIAILIFAIMLIGICAIDANLKTIECTACDNGIRKLRYNEVNYGLIIGLSVITSGIPSLVRLLKNRKTSVQQIRLHVGFRSSTTRSLICWQAL
jgi:hypothetical protein